jgi:uncharacterized alkaline shock family protein YloU
MSDVTSTGGSGSGSEVERSQGGALQTEHGKTSIADSVVEKIAGLAARQVSGVHQMGGRTGRAFGVLKAAVPVGSDEPSPSQGVKVEVGEREAAVDLDLVVEYGVSIVDVSQSVRQNVIRQVEMMTGLGVTEVNISVNDVFTGDTQPEEPRVQ